MKILFILVLCVSFLSCKKNIDVYIYPQPSFPVVNIKDYGAKGDGISDDNAAYLMAETAAYQMKKPLYIPAGKYLLRMDLHYDSIHILGDKINRRFFDNTGTVILGVINCKSKKNIAVTNIGIDSRNLIFINTYNDAALTSGDVPIKGPLNQSFNNIALIGNGYMDYKHGILCQAGSGVSMRNIYLNNFYHGIAVRSSDITIDDVTADYCGFTSVIVKSAKDGNELVQNVSIKNVKINGNQNDVYQRGGVVLIISYNDKTLTQNITVDSVYSSWGSVGAVNVEQDSGLVRNVAISNCYAENCGDNNIRAAYDITGGTNITYSNCRTINCYGTGFRSSNNPLNLVVKSSFESGSAVKAWSGTYQYLQLNGVEIIK